MTATAAALEPFLRDLDAALPADGFWSSPVVVGVSGGGDSMALLLGLAGVAARRPARPQLVVAHAEHDLRPEAAAERDTVAAVASRLGLRFVTRPIATRAPDGVRGEGLEARARRLRYRFLEDVAHECGARHVAIAHTADDQAETILHRALRGTGLAGLAGMAEARQLGDGVALVRPLLGMSRAAVREWLATGNVAWCEDASNLDTRYARNFLRHEILDRCASGPYPAAAAALVRLGGQAAQASAALASAAEHVLDLHCRREPAGGVSIDAAAVAALDQHFLGEVFAALWRREGWPRRDMTARHYACLVALTRAVADDAGSAADFPGPVRATVAPHRRLVLRAAQPSISTRR